MDEISNFEKLIKIAGFTKPQNIKINLKKERERTPNSPRTSDVCTVRNSGYGWGKEGARVWVDWGPFLARDQSCVTFSVCISLSLSLCLRSKGPDCTMSFWKALLPSWHHIIMCSESSFEWFFTGRLLTQRPQCSYFSTCIGPSFAVYSNSVPSGRL